MRTADKISEEAWNSAQKVLKIKATSVFKKKAKVINFTMKIKNAAEMPAKIKCRYCDMEFERQV